MKETAGRSENISRTFDRQPRASRQASFGEILQRAMAPRSKEISPVPGDDPAQKSHLFNHTGLPDNLKTGIENLSGYSMNEVKVHYNSGKPAQLYAHAYTQGTNIYLAPGREQHLPHEAWHVVQQMKGSVKPTVRLEGVNVNDNEELEREADRMGGRAIQMKHAGNNPILATGRTLSDVVQCVGGGTVGYAGTDPAVIRLLKDARAVNRADKACGTEANKAVLDEIEGRRNPEVAKIPDLVNTSYEYNKTNKQWTPSKELIPSPQPPVSTGTYCYIYNKLKTADKKEVVKRVSTPYVQEKTDQVKERYAPYLKQINLDMAFVKKVNKDIKNDTEATTYLTTKIDLFTGSPQEKFRVDYKAKLNLASILNPPDRTEIPEKDINDNIQLDEAAFSAKADLERVENADGQDKMKEKGFSQEVTAQEGAEKARTTVYKKNGKDPGEGNEYIKDDFGNYIRRYAYMEKSIWQLMDFAENGIISGQTQSIKRAAGEEIPKIDPLSVDNESFDAQDQYIAESLPRGKSGDLQTQRKIGIAYLHQWKGSGPRQRGVSLAATPKDNAVFGNAGESFKSDDGAKFKIDLATVKVLDPDNLLLSHYHCKSPTRADKIQAGGTGSKAPIYKYDASVIKNREFYLQYLPEQAVAEVDVHGDKKYPNLESFRQSQLYKDFIAGKTGGVVQQPSTPAFKAGESVAKDIAEGKAAAATVTLDDIQNEAGLVKKVFEMMMIDGRSKDKHHLAYWEGYTTQLKARWINSLTETERHIHINRLNGNVKIQVLSLLNPVNRHTYLNTLDNAGKAAVLSLFVPEDRRVYLDTLVPAEQAAVLSLFVPEDRRAYLDTLVPAEQAAVLSLFVPGDRQAYLDTLVPAGKAAVLSLFVPEDRHTYLNTLDNSGKAEVLSGMATDKVVEYLNECWESRWAYVAFWSSFPFKSDILNLLDIEKRAAVLDLFEIKNRHIYLNTLDDAEKAEVLSGMATDKVVEYLNECWESRWAYVAFLRRFPFKSDVLNLLDTEKKAAVLDLLK